MSKIFFLYFMAAMINCIYFMKPRKYLKIVNDGKIRWIAPNLKSLLWISALLSLIMNGGLMVC